MEFAIGDIYADAKLLQEVSETVKGLSKKETEQLYQLWYAEETNKVIRDMAESI